MNVADKISFNNFCQLCLKISETASDKKAELLHNYIEGWKKKAKELKETLSDVNDSFYPVLRLLLPQLDRERGVYGVKEHTLAKIYTRILSLPKDGIDAMKILHYRTSGSDGGDFAEVAYWVLKNRCTGGVQLSVEDVNNHLDRISTKHGSNDPRGVDSELISLLKATSAEEQKWLIRIILKDMKLGIGQNAIFKCYHPDARDLFNASNNLRKICDVLKNSETRLHEIEIELFSPFKPMLSEECDWRKIDGYMKKSRYFCIETKLDGERFQLHMKDLNFRYYSRSGHDYTSNFGCSRMEGTLTPRIANCFQSNVRSCILDGEMMIWDVKNEQFLSKVAHIDVKNLKEDATHQPCFCIFDVLLYNDRKLTNIPFNYRIEFLNEIIHPLKGAVMVVNRKKISTKDEIVESLNEAIDKREEGIIIKEFLSVYKPNVRKNGGWYKMKPEYMDGLSDTLDLLIIGGYFGSGHHKGNISHFLLGVAVDVSEDSKLFYSVSRVGSGYSMTELLELQNKLSPHWNETKIGEMPSCLEWTKEKPDVWIEPQNSFILEIKAAEITNSNLFKIGYTLRFPRVEKVRYDKCWKNCLTLEEFEEKRKMSSGKLTSRHLLSSEVGILEPKKKNFRLNINLGNQYKGIDASNIECVSNLLNGKEICVFTGFADVHKNEVEKKIIEFGGKLVQNPGKNTFCVLAETDSTTRIKNLIRCGSYDLVRTSWFHSQLNVGNVELPKLKPENFLSMSSATNATFSKLYDEYGDHYTIPATRDSLKNSMMLSLQKSEDILLSNDDKYNLDVELFSGFSPYSLFRLCTAYFDRFPILEDSKSGLLPYLELFQIDFKFGGGKCSDVLSDNITHVVIFSGDLSRLQEINYRNSERCGKFHVVTEKWIQYSLLNGTLSEENSFPP